MPKIINVDFVSKCGGCDMPLRLLKNFFGKK